MDLDGSDRNKKARFLGLFVGFLPGCGGAGRSRTAVRKASIQESTCLFSLLI